MRGHRIVHTYRKRCLALGAGGLALSLVGAFLATESFFRAYLIGYLYWWSIALGSLALLLLHNLTGGGWGRAIRALLRASIRTVPFVALAYVPILAGLLLGAHDLYPWTHHDGEHAELIEKKAAYLNLPFFSVRSLLYFAVWLALAFTLRRWGAPEEEPTESGVRRLSGPGLVLYGLTVTFAAVDWGMSLEPEWFSMIYGVLFIVGQGLGALAFSIVLLLLLGRGGVVRVDVDRQHDLGNLMLAFVMLWAYISFSQYLIIWSGNLPEEIPWYIRRTGGGWEWFGVALIAIHFALPFLLLLSRKSKRTARVLLGIALTLVFMRFVDLFWIIKPAFVPEGIALHWLDLVVPVGLGGLWLGIFFGGLSEPSARPTPPAPAGGDAALEPVAGGEAR